MATIEIDGKQVECPNGSMIIKAADDAGVYIPRFCYHKKLSIAANCRMCLVQVGEGKKAMPACATPVAEGMKVYTKSKVALDAQKAVMEFLLINHPLDCPICDQGGECELQDLSMGFGVGESRYNEGKRSVKDKSLGSLIATEMTRCIQCTRCIRFSREIAGAPELGLMNRGEHEEVTTYVEKSLESEVSGNMIDVCPVGALTAKPSRFTARPWELQQRDSIAPHDCLGSNIHVHVRRDKVMRVTPKENEALNEVWLSDRDRFSYEGLNSKERLTQPMIKKNGAWEVVSWEAAVEYAVEGLQKVLNTHGAEQLGGLISPSSTLEEMVLFQKLLRGVGCENSDYRLHQLDFNDQEGLNLVNIADLEKLDACLLVGSTLQKEVPLASLRLRKMAKNGGQLFAITPHQSQCDTLPFANSLISADIVASLAMLANALGSQEKVFAEHQPNADIKALAEKLKLSKNFAMVLGQLALNHLDASKIKGIAQHIAELLQGKLIIFTEGANSAGAVLAGVQSGLNTQAMVAQKLKGYILFNVEPELDCANSARALAAMNNAEFVVSLSPFNSEVMYQYADVILPITPFTETSGTFVNIQGDWQSFNAVVKPFGEARPGWKVLRVLGNFLKVEKFDYDSSQEVRDELHAKAQDIKQAHYPLPTEIQSAASGLQRLSRWFLYRSDALVRRAQSLQNTPKNNPKIVINTKTAAALNLQHLQRAIVRQGNIEVELPLFMSDTIAENYIFVPNGFAETAVLNDSETIEVQAC